jgi:hypothetical protein
MPISFFSVRSKGSAPLLFCVRFRTEWQVLLKREAA